jgi:two-component system, response regulator YesN
MTDTARPGLSKRELLRRARGYIRTAYRDPDLSLDDVAREVGVSRRELQRVFRAEAQESFKDFLLCVRMRRAAVLLSRKRNPLPAREVAIRVGYRGASGFGQAFVRFYGYRPSEIQPAPPEYLGTLQGSD